MPQMFQGGTALLRLRIDSWVPFTEEHEECRGSRLIFLCQGIFLNYVMAPGLRM